MDDEGNAEENQEEDVDCERWSILVNACLHWTKRQCAIYVGAIDDVVLRICCIGRHFGIGGGGAGRMRLECGGAPGGCDDKGFGSKVEGRKGRATSLCLEWAISGEGDWKPSASSHCIQSISTLRWRPYEVRKFDRSHR